MGFLGLAYWRIGVATGLPRYATGIGIGIGIGIGMGIGMGISLVLVLVLVDIGIGIGILQSFTLEFALTGGPCFC